MMARATAPSSCRTLASAIDPYLDGELMPAQMVEVDTHIAECCACREHIALSRAMRCSLRRATPAAPSALRERIQAAMAAERATQALKEQQAAAQKNEEELSSSLSPVVSLPQVRAMRAVAEAAVSRVDAVNDNAHDEPVLRRSSAPARTRYALPFAVAAGVAFAISVRRPPSQIDAHVQSAAMAPAKTTEASMSTSHAIGLDGILDDLVALHAQPLPPEVTQPDQIRTFDPFVGVPVEPPKLQTFGAQWVGGRMLPLRESRAAALQYSLAGGHRVTVYVYDPRRVKQESRQLQSRIVRNAPVFVGNVRGYNVAATERRGVGYALATDLDERESLELVAASAPLIEHAAPSALADRFQRSALRRGRRLLTRRNGCHADRIA